jgi:uncharacterized protein YdhG (YjbR/CyaY superfamily)
MVRDPAVDAYLASLPQDQREALGRLREEVERIVPDAVETISYGMPAFKLRGKFLVSYAGWKDHCSIYPLTDTFMESHAQAIEGFDRTKGSLHFTPAVPLPATVIEDLVRARVDDLESGGR